jgi:hypothetical protein
VSDSEWTIEGEELTVSASETVTTGEYESASVSVEYEASITGPDFDNGVPRSLRDRVFRIQREAQVQVKEAAEMRQEEANREDTSEGDS